MKKGIIISREIKDVNLINLLVKKINENLSKIGYEFELVLIPNSPFSIKKTREIKEKLLNAVNVISLIINKEQITVESDREIEDFIGYDLVNMKNVISISLEGLYKEVDWHSILLDFDDSKQIDLKKWGESEFDFIIRKLESVLFLNESKTKTQFEKEKKQKKIEKTAASFVEESISELKRRETKLNRLSIIWNIIGFLALVVGITVTSIFISSGVDEDWDKLIFYSIKSFILIILLLAASKYAFNLSKTYMNESLKNADRIHAISFGKFYLQLFGDRIESEEVKEVFQNWNINSESAFLKLNSDNYDPNFVEKIIKLIELAKK